jgi:tripeptidyl-peptidase I
MLKRAGGLGQPFSGSGPKQASIPVAITPSLENCDEIITLDCLRALYNINYKPRSTDKNTFGIGSLCRLYLVLRIFTMLLYS